MSNLLFVNGQIRSLESKLLSVSKLDRMIGAPTAEDAFRVMVELQYSEYFDDKTEAKDFADIIEQGLKETKNLLKKGSDHHKGLDLLFSRFDINNLKRAYKAKFLEGATSIESFTEHAGYSVLGDLEKEQLEQVVFKGIFPEDFPAIYVKNIPAVEAVFAETNDFRLAEYTLDKIFAQHLLSIAKYGKSYGKRLATMIIDMSFIRSCARALLIHKEQLKDQYFVDHGISLEYAASSITSVETLKKAIASNPDFSVLAKSIEIDQSAVEVLTTIERGLDQLFVDFLEQSAQGEIDTVQVPLRYFEQRLRDARRLKFVMFAKFNGFDADTIYKALGTL